MALHPGRRLKFMLCAKVLTSLVIDHKLQQRKARWWHKVHKTILFLVELTVSADENATCLGGKALTD